MDTYSNNMFDHEIKERVDSVNLKVGTRWRQL